jgi:hypothetical protein
MSDGVNVITSERACFRMEHALKHRRVSAAHFVLTRLWLTSTHPASDHRSCAQIRSFAVLVNVDNLIDARTMCAFGTHAATGCQAPCPPNSAMRREPAGRNNRTSRIRLFVVHAARSGTLPMNALRYRLCCRQHERQKREVACDFVLKSIIHSSTGARSSMEQ